MRVKLYDSSNSVNKYAEGVIEHAIKEFMEQPRYAGFEVNREQPHTNLMNAAAKVEKMELDKDGNIWGEVEVLPTPKGETLKSLLYTTPENIDFGIYGLGRKEGDTIIDYEFLGVSIFPKRNDN